MQLTILILSAANLAVLLAGAIAGIVFAAKAGPALKAAKDVTPFVGKAEPILDACDQFIRTSAPILDEIRPIIPAMKSVDDRMQTMQPIFDLMNQAMAAQQMQMKQGQQPPMMQPNPLMAPVVPQQ